MNAAVPEPGQLVEVRRRQWVVMDVAASALPGPTSQNPQHLVRLSSIDDDALGETLEAIWEIEPGAQVLETAGLPTVDGYDPPEQISAFLDAVRWGATTSADHLLLQSPFRSGIEIQDHQLEPLVRAVGMSRTCLLIADDVGLGKTIEAGLVVQELLIRHRARSVLIVCPASLQVKWKNEMWDKFGLDFRIVNTEYVKTLRRERGLHANPWTSFPRLVTSMDWMKSGEGLRLIKDVLPPHLSYPRKFDILIVDEAHNVAPSGASHYALPSQRTRLIRRIAPHFQHRMFLTATPHNGYKESFAALLELLDDQRFPPSTEPDPAQLQRVLVRRLKTALVDKDGKAIYPARAILPLHVDYTKDEQEAHRMLKAYTESRAASVIGTSSAMGSDFIHKLLKKRLFSSPMAFATTLAKHRVTLEKGRRQKPDRMQERILRKAIARCAEDYADDSALEDAEAAAVATATRMGQPLTVEQRGFLHKLTTWAEAAKHRVDSKATAILSLLDDRLKTDGKPNDKRIILFTEYRATHDWLFQILVSNGWGGDALVALHGGTDPDEREQIKAAFQADPTVAPVRILLATDAASEGIDLQNHCNCLVHVEIPWNPNVLEQRNGRIDRHGQRADEVLIWHPVGAGTTMDEVQSSDAADLAGDQEFLLRAVQKVQRMRDDLGCVGPVIASQIEEAMLGRRRSLDTRGAEQQAAKVKKFVVAERNLKQRVAQLHQRLLEARTTQRLEPPRLRRAVDVALSLAGRSKLEPAKLDGFEGDSFHLPLLTGSWAQALEGICHPHTGVRRPVTFDHAAAAGRDDVVLAHLQHKLVQMSLRLLRAEVWAPGEQKNLHRVAVRIVPDVMTAVPVIVAWSRLVVTGAGHHRLHEELTMAAGELKDTGFARIPTLKRIEELLEASEGAEPAERSFVLLQRRMEEQRSGLLRAVEARSNERLRFLINALERRHLAEVADLNGVLDDLQALIETELEDKPVPAQLSMWPEAQQQAYRRDEVALKARLARIPEERVEELAAIQRRYDSPVARTFPVALEFLVPSSMINGGV